jgi:hypothetical protein
MSRVCLYYYITDAEASRDPAKLIILGGEGQAQADRQFQVRGVIGGEALGASECQRLAKSTRRRLVVDLDI